MTKKILLGLLALTLSVVAIYAVDTKYNVSSVSQSSGAEITFDTLRINAGTFPSNKPIQEYRFRFKNTGDAPLILNQVIATCGCTVPSYPKNPIKPGESGVIEVTYNGTNKFPGHFAKTVTVRSNAQTGIVRLTVEGTMTK